MYCWWAKNLVRIIYPPRYLAADDYRQANDPAFLKAAMRYTRDIVVTGEVLRFTPSPLQL